MADDVAFAERNPELRGQVTGAAQAAEEVPIENIYLEAIPQTNADIRAGRVPGYGVVWFTEREGARTMETAPGMVFRADVRAAKERELALRKQRSGEAREQEISDIEKVKARRERLFEEHRRAVEHQRQMFPLPSQLEFKSRSELVEN